MRFIQTFDPTAAASGTIKVGTGDPGQKVVIYNESAVTLFLDFQNGSHTYIHAWEANYWTIGIPTREITWSSVRNLVGAGQAPANYVDVFVYGVDEPVEGTYPVQLARLISLGNQVTPVSTASSLVNDNAASTQVVEATVSGSSGSNVAISNDGTTTIKQYTGGALVPLLQLLVGGVSPSVKLAASSYQTEVLGSLKVDSTTDLVGAVTLEAGATLTGGTLTLLKGTLARINIASGFINAGKNTVTHGLGAKPVIVLITKQYTSAPSSDWEVGYDPSTMTSVNIDIWSSTVGIIDLVTLA